MKLNQPIILPLLAALSGLICVTCAERVRGICPIARDLYWKQKVPRRLIPTILCITENLSGFNTSLVTEADDGTKNYGLFQVTNYFTLNLFLDPGSRCIQSVFWFLLQFNEAVECEFCKSECKACALDCEKFADRRLDDDMRCWRTIFYKYGLDYWDIWTEKCKGKFLLPYLHNCGIPLSWLLTKETQIYSVNIC